MKIVVLGPAEAVTPISASVQTAEVLLPLEKSNQIPLFQAFQKKNPITFNSLRQTYKGKLLCRLLNVFELPREAQ